MGEIKIVGVSSEPRDKTTYRDYSQAEIWSKLDVLKWIISNGWNETIVKTFYSKGIDGQILLYLNENLLENDLEIKNPNLRKEILSEIDQIKQSTTPKQKIPLKLNPNLIKEDPNLLIKPETNSIPTENFLFPWKKPIRIGDQIDASDSLGIWSEAVVLSVDELNQQVFVHFCRQSSIWDEWVHVDSQRVAQRGSSVDFKTEEILEEAIFNESVKSSEGYEEKPSMLKTFESAFTNAPLKHRVPDSLIFSNLRDSLARHGKVSPQALQKELHIGRFRAKRSCEDFLTKLITGESLEPPEMAEPKKEKTMSSSSSSRSKRARRTTAMLTEDWKSGNRRGLWKCPKCSVVLTAQKRHSHPCYRDHRVNSNGYETDFWDSHLERRFLNR